MLIKLPITINDKIDIRNFIIKKHENKITLRPQEDINDKLFKVMISNKEFCLNSFNLKFPLEIQIFDNKHLFCKFFFIIALLNGFDCELNFFSNLEKIIQDNFNKNYSFIKLSYIEKNIINIIKKCNLHFESRKNFEDIDDMSLYMDDQLNYGLNLTYMILYKYPNYNMKDFKSSKINDILPKKVLSAFNLIKNFKIDFKGCHDTSIANHLENINSSVVNMKKDSYYFFKFNDDKIIKMQISNITSNQLILKDSRVIETNQCEISNYNPRFKNQINFNYFIKELMKYHMDFKLLVGYKFFKKEQREISNILKYIYLENNNSIYLASLRNLNFTFNTLNSEKEIFNNKEENLELHILKDPIISIDYITYLSNKYRDDLEMKIKILKIIFENYNFPLSFNKKKLSDNFEVIMYFSFINYEDLIKVVDKDKIYLINEVISIIPPKLKNLYFNLMKTYYQFKNNSLENITYNFKFYKDYIYIYVIKNIIQNNTIVSNLFDNKPLFEKLVATYSKNYILTQLIDCITWENLANRLSYLNYIYKNDQLVFYQNKLNKNLFDDNIDYKVKAVIQDKFVMYKYLKKEKDYIKWTKFIKNYVDELYEKKISISSDDLVLLGQLIYKLYNVENQNLKDEKYNDLVTFCQMNKKLIISENRINLMIRDKLGSLNCQMNLGFFAKHLNFTNIEKIELSENPEIMELNLELKKMTQKYYKYKGKYLRTKSLTATSSQQNTSTV